MHDLILLIIAIPIGLICVEILLAVGAAILTLKVIVVVAIIGFFKSMH